jgi:hypothetical protein
MPSFTAATIVTKHRQSPAESDAISSCGAESASPITSIAMTVSDGMMANTKRSSRFRVTLFVVTSPSLAHTYLTLLLALSSFDE